jgi:glycosyltransferase involved in cell wall biosynthesis
LPIGEALAHGLTVVTTNETGLATWLADNGHTVIDEKHVATELGDAIVTALKNQLQPSAVETALPSIPGRIEADKWLHTL